MRRVRPFMCLVGRFYLQFELNPCHTQIGSALVVLSVAFLHFTTAFWKSRRTTPIVKVATTGAALPTTLGAISTAGIGNIALTETETTAVKEKVDRLESNRSEYEENKGTTTSHYPLYLHDNGCNGSTPGVQRLYLVMDNAPIHQSKDIEFAIKQLWSVATVAYTSPPYSPELNPIEQLCPKFENRPPEDDHHMVIGCPLKEDLWNRALAHAGKHSYLWRYGDVSVRGE
ncbi:hypothetical protein [Absidia glauca]|uniref:Tc1-like transposase DDE domain-containing protein n=1 Tax=Absidia glauca TaxID=4829 RepID=A0A163LTJ9_ABSGL|nr:hypothetical protein [Absidia glauca]